MPPPPPGERIPRRRASFHGLIGGYLPEPSGCVKPLFAPDERNRNRLASIPCRPLLGLAGPVLLVATVLASSAPVPDAQAPSADSASFEGGSTRVASLNLVYEGLGPSVSWRLSQGVCADEYRSGSPLIPPLGQTHVTAAISARGNLDTSFHHAVLRLKLASTEATFIEADVTLYANDQPVSAGGGGVFLYPSIPSPQEVRWMRWGTIEIPLELEESVHARSIHADVRLHMPPGTTWFLLADGASGIAFGGTR